MKSDLILASASPRRKELLQMLQIPFRIIVSEIEEVLNPELHPADMVQSLAKQKAISVAEKHPSSFVIGSDTIVVYNGIMLGKPENIQDAVRILRMLSGKSHEVYTGVAIINNGHIHSFYEKTEVTFFSLTEDEIQDYVATGEPMDKAGAYGIQGYGSLLVKNINGDYYSVVGFPIARTKRELFSLGFCR